MYVSDVVIVCALNPSNKTFTILLYLEGFFYSALRILASNKLLKVLRMSGGTLE